jgi:hypothetical protein
VTSNYRFIGLAYEWQFEQKCWVISSLAQVKQKYREEFINTYDRIFALFQQEFEQYAYHSEIMRDQFAQQKRRFPLLHRNGAYSLVSARSERTQRVGEDRLPHFGPYR